MKTATSLGGTAVIAIVLIGTGHGQDAADTDSGEELVVTAQRRSQQIQNVPVSVVALPATVLEDRAVTNVLELQRALPSLTVQDTGSNISPFLRGVGSTTTGAGQFASVATYVDGVYMSTLQSGAFDFDNVERIEVVSGPQGALYGRNATGGAIIIATPLAEPGDEAEFSLRGKYGSYNTREASAAFRSGLGENWGLYVAGSFRKHDGYIDNLNPPGSGPHNDDLNDRDSWSVQAAITFDATDRLRFVMRGSHFESDDRLGMGLQAVGLDIPVAGPLNGNQAYYAGTLQSFGFPADAAVAAALGLEFSDRFGATFDNETNGFVNGVLSGSDRPGSFSALTVDTFSLKATYDFDAFQVSSLTAYSESESRSATELMAANPASYPAGLEQGAIGFSGDFPSHNFQQEVQVASTGDGSVQWIGGVLYFSAAGETDLTGDLPGGLSLRTALNDWSVESVAAFAQATFRIDDVWGITLGGRYTDEDYKIVDKFDPSAPFSLPGLVNQGTKSLSSEQLTYTARLEYDNGPLLAYLGVSTGFKGGTLSPVNLGSPGVDPEDITSIEGGIKWEINKSIRLNGTVFHYIYDNIHIAYTDTASGANQLVNGTGAKLTGLELEFFAEPTDWLTLRANALFLDSSYDNDVPTSGTQPSLATEGNRLAGAPEYAITLGADVTLLELESGAVTFTADALISSGYFFDAENLIGTGGASDDSFTTVDLSLTYEHGDGGWRVSAWGTNVFDAEYFQSGIVASGILRTAVAASPSVFGISVGVTF